MILKGVFAALPLLVAGSVPATAQAPAVRTLIEQARAVDAQCRSGDPSDPKTKAACKSWSEEVSRLNRLDWCYGQRGQTRADMDWHRCKRSSYRARNFQG